MCHLFTLISNIKVPFIIYLKIKLEGIKYQASLINNPY